MLDIPYPFSRVVDWLYNIYRATLLESAVHQIKSISLIEAASYRQTDNKRDQKQEIACNDNTAVADDAKE